MHYKKKIYLLVILSAVLFFQDCKKYPENTLWFKKPEKVFKGGKITSYTMGGLDRMPYFINLYKNFPYNYFGSSIENVFDLEFSYDAGSESFSSKIGKGSFRFSSTGREVEISFKPENQTYGAENIFIKHLSWKVLKLTKNGQLKIETDYNFKKYQIQFN